MCTVFSTAELLEQVLSGLEIQDLLRVQRVSRHWHTVTASSTMLRWQMFLAPEKPRFAWRWCEERQDAKDTEPSDVLVKVYGAVDPDDGDTRVSGRFNELFFESDADFGNAVEDVHCGLVSFRSQKIINGLQHLPQDSKLAKMLITQPPAKKIELAIRAEWTGIWSWDEEIENPGGVTLGDVLRALHRTHDAYKETHHLSAWRWDGVYMRTHLAFPTEEQAAGDKIVNEPEE